MSVSGLSAVDDDLLVLASQRDLRRRIFDAFDASGHARIFTARNGHHAMILMEGRAPPALHVVAFEGDGRMAREALARWRRESSSEQSTQTPVLVVIAEDFALHGSALPDGVADWLHARQIESELALRAQRVCSASPRAPARAETLENFDREQHDRETEWLVVDRLRRCIVTASAAVARHTGLDVSVLHARPLADVLALDDAAVVALLGDESGGWHGCARVSAAGADSGRARLSHAGAPSGVDRVVIEFRSSRADLEPTAALDLLALITHASARADPHGAASRALIQAMSLDYLALWSAPSPSTGSSRLLFQHGQDSDPAFSDSALATVLSAVWLGQETLPAPASEAQADVDLAARSMLAALPLLDGQGRACGALLLGRRRGFGREDVLEPLLRCVAGHFATLERLSRSHTDTSTRVLCDALTGLPNRLLFEDRLDRVIREALRSGECFALLLVDLDQLALINRSHSIAEGDRVLCATAERLQGIVRASDTVARLGGDTFVLVLRHVINAHDVLRVAEKIIQTMESPVSLSTGASVTVSASVGISFYPDDALDAHRLLDHADQAVRIAKAAGRNRFHLFELDPHQSQHKQVAVLARLRHAQENGELQVVYQPQVDALTEEVMGMEALVRWAHPDLGVLSPGAFIPLAEQSGLIVAIGQWVLHTACKQAHAWQCEFGLHLRLGVNLSAVQLMQGDLLDVVATIIEETGMDAGLLELEITESISIKEAPHLVENLHGLHRLGCRIAIDDFGTGAASLDYLRRLPADRIKIDQSFVRNIGVDPDDEAIVRATIDMAHRLNRGVVAEGVETEQHLEFLRANGCDELQGFLFARPLSEAAFTRLLSDRRELLAGSVA